MNYYFAFDFILKISKLNDENDNVKSHSYLKEIN